MPLPARAIRRAGGGGTNMRNDSRRISDDDMYDVVPAGEEDDGTKAEVMAEDNRSEASHVHLSDSDGDEAAADFRERLASWSSGLYDCHLDCPGCVRTCLCCPLVAAETASEFNGTNTALNLLCTLCFPCSASIYLRHAIRVGYGVDGNALSDVAVAVVCPYCSLCQLQRELTSRGGGVTCGGPVMVLMAS